MMNNRILYQLKLLVLCLLWVSIPSYTYAQVDYGFYGIETIAWSPDGTMYALGGGTPVCNPDDNSSFEIQIRDTLTSSVIKSLAGHICSVQTLVWSPDSSKIASGTRTLEDPARIWDISTEQVIAELDGYAIGMDSLSWHPNGTLIAGVVLPSGRNGRAYIWDANTGMALSTTPFDGGTPETAVSQVQWNPNGTLIATARAAGDVVNIWDTNTFALVNTLQVGHTTIISSLKWSPDGNFIATSDLDGNIVVTNVNSGLTTSFASLSRVEELDWSPDGDYIVSASTSSDVEIWDAQSGNLLETLSYTGEVLAVAWSPDGDNIVYGGFEVGQTATSEIIIPSIINNLAINALTLLNTDADTDIRTLSTTSSETIDIASNDISLRANTDPATVGSVVFTVDGNVVATDNSAPYTIAGENGSDILPWNIALGAHTIVATPYSGADGTGDAGTPLTVQVNIVDSSQSGLAVTSMTLINADTDTDIRSLLTSGTDTIDIASNGISIRANTSPATVGSVVFALNSNANYRTENGAPYAIFTNTNAGQYEPWVVAPGNYTLTATPYSGSNGSGTAGTPLTVNFDILDSGQSGIAVTSLTLINADTDTDIRTLSTTSTETIDITNNTVSIRANTTPATVGSVVFTLDSTIIQTETIAPYAIAGDQSNGTNFNPWNVSPGTYQLTVTPYDGSGGTGNAGTSIVVDLQVVDNNLPGGECTATGGLVQEGEAGVRAGNFVVASDTIASGGQYVHVPNGTGNASSPGSSSNVRFCFPVTDTGTYRLRVWLHAANSGDDSYFVDYNGASILWNTEINTIYSIGYVRDTGTPVNSAEEYVLSTGNHQFTFYLREDGTRIDKVELVNNDSGETVLYRVDAGASSAYTDTLGNVWAADSNFSGGSANTWSASILSTIEDPLYTTERSQSNNVGFSYSFPVSNGTYTVRLHFAEIWFTGGSGRGTIDSPSARRRVFDVQIEGTTVLDEFHIVSETLQPRVAHVETFSVNVTDGTLNINFPPATTDNPTIEAIEIVLGG